MANQIISLQDWLQTPAGRYLLRWEQTVLDQAVGDIFGYQALQLGLPQLAGLQTNRMPQRWTAQTLGAHWAAAESTAGQPTPGAVVTTGLQPIDLVSDPSALPFSAATLDLLVLPHTLEFSHDPHGTLREVERVLVPEGRVVICGLNPNSLWGWAQRRQRLWLRDKAGDFYLPGYGEFIGYWRLRDWLRLLGFEIESGSFGCYAPAVRSQAWLDRMDWMDKLGPRYWPILGAAYCLVAVKKVRGTRLLSPKLKRNRRLATAPVSVAPRAHSSSVLTDRSSDKPAER